MDGEISVALVFHNEIIDLHLRIPVPLRSDNRLWLKAMERLDPKIAHIADANTGYSPYMPQLLVSMLTSGKEAISHIPVLSQFLNRTQDIATRQGLSPISYARFDWQIRKNEKLKKILSDTLNDPMALPESVFDLKAINRIFTEHLAGKGQHRLVLFALLTFGHWHRKHCK